MERNSILSSSLLPPVQNVMTRFGGAGNEKALIGLDGWLFYKPDFDYIVQGGFLDAERLHSRRGENDLHPDPRPAILNFHDELRQRGIELVVVPAPTENDDLS